MPAKILVVEDSSDIILAINEALDSEEFEVMSAMDASVAMAMIEAKAPDLAIVDQGLPDGSGSEICRAVSEKWGVPVIMFTGEGMKDTVLECLESGAADYVLKGTGIDELVKRVKAHLVRTGVLAE
jgi:DNA-binding response OmpR family regulator